MEIIRLDTGQSIASNARREFSNSRSVLANFFEAEDLLKGLLKELGLIKFISRHLEMAVQQMERSEGGLSAIEERAMRDMCEHAGAIKVLVFDQSADLTHQQALEALKQAKR